MQILFKDKLSTIIILDSPNLWGLPPRLLYPTLIKIKMGLLEDGVNVHA